MNQGPYKRQRMDDAGNDNKSGGGAWGNSGADANTNSNWNTAGAATSGWGDYGN